RGPCEEVRADISRTRTMYLCRVHVHRSDQYLLLRISPRSKRRVGTPAFPAPFHSGGPIMRTTRPRVPLRECKRLSSLSTSKCALRCIIQNETAGQALSRDDARDVPAIG